MKFFYEIQLNGRKKFFFLQNAELVTDLAILQKGEKEGHSIGLEQPLHLGTWDRP